MEKTSKGRIAVSITIGEICKVEGPVWRPVWRRQPASLVEHQSVGQAYYPPTDALWRPRWAGDCGFMHGDHSVWRQLLPNQGVRILKF